MNKVLKNIIQKEVWDKCVMVEKEEADRHLKGLIKDYRYPVGVFECLVGHFIYEMSNPPHNLYLDQAIINNIYPDDSRNNE